MVVILSVPVNKQTLYSKGLVQSYLKSREDLSPGVWRNSTPCCELLVTVSKASSHGWMAWCSPSHTQQGPSSVMFSVHLHFWQQEEKGHMHTCAPLVSEQVVFLRRRNELCKCKPQTGLFMLQGNQHPCRCGAGEQIQICKYSEKKAQEVAPQLLSDTDKLPELYSPKQIDLSNCPGNTSAEDSLSFFNYPTN